MPRHLQLLVQRRRGGCSPTSCTRPRSTRSVRRDGGREAHAGPRSSGAARRAGDVLPEVLHAAEARLRRRRGPSGGGRRGGPGPRRRDIVSRKTPGRTPDAGRAGSARAGPSNFNPAAAVRSRRPPKERQHVPGPIVEQRAPARRLRVRVSRLAQRSRSSSRSAPGRTGRSRLCRSRCARSRCRAASRRCACTTPAARRGTTLRQGLPPLRGTGFSRRGDGGCGGAGIPARPDQGAAGRRSLGRPVLRGRRP